MFSQYFAYYLLKKGYIHSAELQDILEYQAKTSVKLGIMAINEGMMTPGQVEEVHQMQTHMDKKFGELAVERGFLSQGQLYDLLSSQKTNHLLLGQALVDRGYMTLYQVTQALHDYKQEHGFSDSEFRAIRQGDIELLVDHMLPEDMGDHKPIYKSYLALFSKNMIRFIDPQIRLEIRRFNEPLQVEWGVRQEIGGEIQLHTSLLADGVIFLSLASRYAKEELSQIDELSQASAGEFMNLHNGIFLVNMSNRGIELELKPQEVLSGIEVQPPDTGLLVTVHMTGGSFDLALTPNALKL